MGATINKNSFKLSYLILGVVLLQYSSSFPQNGKMSCGFHLGKVFPYYNTNREPDGISDVTCTSTPNTSALSQRARILRSIRYRNAVCGLCSLL